MRFGPLRLPTVPAWRYDFMLSLSSLYFLEAHVVVSSHECLVHCCILHVQANCATDTSAHYSRAKPAANAPSKPTADASAHFSTYLCSHPFSYCALRPWVVSNINQVSKSVNLAGLTLTLNANEIGIRFLNVNEICEKCDVGRWSNVTRAPWPRSCEECLPGRAASRLATVEPCTVCIAGKFSTAARDECGACSPGQFVWNASACLLCPTGTYAPVPTNDACIACGAGFATSVTLGAMTCSACSPGTFATGGNISCSTCEAGTFSGTRASDW